MDKNDLGLEVFFNFHSKPTITNGQPFLDKK